MLSVSLRRKILLLILAVSLMGSWSSAGPRLASPARPLKVAVHNLAGRFWGVLTSLWNEIGCNIDPDGRCITSPSTTPQTTGQADEGCNIDPDGRCIQ